jgi:hypothetical protein
MKEFSVIEEARIFQPVFFWVVSFHVCPFIPTYFFTRRFFSFYTQFPNRIFLPRVRNNVLCQKNFTLIDGLSFDRHWTRSLLLAL